jgi:6,7-dimethyl-8-ribityllumazine synthase
MRYQTKTPVNTGVLATMNCNKQKEKEKEKESYKVMLMGAVNFSVRCP